MWSCDPVKTRLIIQGCYDLLYVPKSATSKTDNICKRNAVGFDSWKEDRWKLGKNGDITPRVREVEKKEFLWMPAIICGTQQIKGTHWLLLQGLSVLLPLPGLLLSHLHVFLLAGPFLNGVLSEHLTPAPATIIIIPRCFPHSTSHHLIYYVFHRLYLSAPSRK